MKRLALFLSFPAMIAVWLMWGRSSSEPGKPGGGALQCPMHPWVKSAHAERCTLCGMELVAAAAGGAAPGDGVRGASVMLAPGSVDALGVRTSPVARRPLVRTLRISGMIGEDESRHGVVSAPVEGRIDGLPMNHEGQTITRRQPLATMFSRTLLAAAKDYREALPEGGARLETARRKLEQYGLVWEQIKAIPDRQPDDLYFGILSPLSGTIVKSYVAEGQHVKEGEKLFEVADFTRLWFHFLVSEQDLPLLKPGQVVTLRTASLPGETLRSRVAAVSPNLDEATGLGKARVVLENPERRLRNGLFAEGLVELEAPEVLAVARTAVLWPGAVPRVFVEKEPGLFEQHEVELGRLGDADWEVTGGLKEGERVVTHGNVLIDGQARLNLPTPGAP